MFCWRIVVRLKQNEPRPWFNELYRWTRGSVLIRPVIVVRRWPGTKSFPRICDRSDQICLSTQCIGLRPHRKLISLFKFWLSLIQYIEWGICKVNSIFASGVPQAHWDWYSLVQMDLESNLSTTIFKYEFSASKKRIGIPNPRRFSRPNGLLTRLDFQQWWYKFRKILPLSISKLYWFTWHFFCSLKT